MSQQQHCWYGLPGERFPSPPHPPTDDAGNFCGGRSPRAGRAHSSEPPAPIFSFSEGLVPTSPRRNHLKSLVWILFSGLHQAEGGRPQHEAGAGGNFLPLCHGGYLGKHCPVLGFGHQEEGLTL